MVVYQWFQRLGQVLAPDPNYVPEAVNEESGSVWQILAPDPNFAPEQGTPDTEHVTRNLTDMHISTPALPSTPRQSFRSPMYSPSPFRTSSQVLHELQSPRCNFATETDPQLDNRVLSAAKKHAETLGSPEGAKKSELKYFRFCASAKEIAKNQLLALQNAITRNPRLLTERCSRMNAVCPDGYTFFMAAAYANHLAVLNVIWDYAVANPNVVQGVSPENLLKDSDLQGMTAFHVAAARGHIEALHFLKTKHDEVFGVDAEASTDLLGRTPLGVALVSREGDARTNRRAMVALLYRVNDKSIMGSPLPMPQRVVPGSTILQAVAGMSEMPGKRGLMEDHIVCHGSRSALLLSVCDGHGDGGLVSHFVAEGLVASLDAHMPSLLEGGDDLWRDTFHTSCLEVDEELRAMSLLGGSTALLVAITAKNVFVANVGDCRCILVEFKSEQKTEEFLSGSVSFNADGVWNDMFSVSALSIDHKPSLEQERDRIVQSGHDIVQEAVQENGQDIVLHKIKTRDGSSQLSCSRSFGDFEFKANNNLSPEAQAVTAVPEVQVHDRRATDAFVILACDGVWDVMSNDEVALFVTKRVNDLLSSNLDSSMGTLLPKVGDDLLIHCMDNGAVDNLSVVVAALSAVADRSVGPAGAAAKTLDFGSPSV